MKDLKNASEYNGDFVRGERNGSGTYKWGKNYEYDGHFKRGQLDGEGTFKFKGKVYAGVWSNGTEVKINEINNKSLQKSRHIDVMPSVREMSSDEEEGQNSKKDKKAPHDKQIN